MEQNNHLVWAEQLCSRRELCPHDVRIKLKAKGVGDEEAERVVVALIQHNFLNMERYVRAFVHDKSCLQGWGPEKIRYALRTKEIPDSIVREMLADIDQSAKQERLCRIIEAKRRSVKAASQKELREKLIRFALGRGFSYEDIIAELTG